MLTRFYADNYGCLVNFDFRPRQIELVFGRNGSGKSTMAGALASIRAFIFLGRPAEEAFPSNTRTRWLTSELQTFELEVKHEGGSFLYKLSIRNDGRVPVTVHAESLDFDGKPLVRSELGLCMFHKEDFSPGGQFSMPLSASALGSVMPLHSSSRIAVFRQWVAGLYWIRPAPGSMSARADRSAPHPDPIGSNFANWYLNLALEQMDQVSELRGDLAEAIDGFDSLSLKDAGQGSRILHLKFKDVREPFAFDELSDGQRNLVFLYTLLRCGVRPHGTICFDEPDNYLALAEIQPWLRRLEARVEEQSAQAIIISHHPEFLNQLAPSNGVRFVQRGSGGVVIEPYQPGDSGSLTPAEQIARGWDRA